MNELDKNIERIYAETLNRLSRLLHTPSLDLAERKRVHLALRALHRAYAKTGVASLAHRATALNKIAESLHAVLGSQTISPLDTLAIEYSLAETQQLLLRVAAEAFPDEQTNHVATTSEAQENAVPAKDTVPSTTSSNVPEDKREEYVAMFNQCMVRPAKLATVNWHAAKVVELRNHYERAGDPVGVPWWFIGAAHALESAFSFAGHLHNGDPLTARTQRVPTGRPPTGTPPFTWEESAADALKYQSLHQWNDWSIAGALYQWERYNGFGYRKYNVPSPYLWSFSNHYNKGRYVRDHVFDPEAVSNQCGAATLLRVLVNQGVVRF